MAHRPRGGGCVQGVSDGGRRCSLTSCSRGLRLTRAGVRGGGGRPVPVAHCCAAAAVLQASGTRGRRAKDQPSGLHELCLADGGTGALRALLARQKQQETVATTP